MAGTGLFPSIGEALSDLVSEIAHDAGKKLKKRAKLLAALYLEESEKPRPKAPAPPPKALPEAGIEMVPGPDGVYVPKVP